MSSSQDFNIPVSQDLALLEKTLQEFVIMFSLNEKEMLNRLVDHYPDTARDLEKGLSRVRGIAKLLRG